MNRRITFAIGVMLVAGSAIGAAVHGGRHGGGKASLAELLALTEVQQAELTEIRISFSEQKQAIKEGFRAGFEALLTADQLEMLAANQDGGGKRHRRGPLAEILQLTDEQLTQKTELRLAKMEEMQLLHAEYKSAFEAALTAEQLATLEEARASFLPRHRKNDGEPGDVEEADAESPGNTAADEAIASFAVSAIGEATAVEEMSWGGVKSSLAR